MTRYRSILAAILAVVMTFLVSCSSPTAAKSPTYTAEQIQKIQQIATVLSAQRGTLPTLEGKIQNQNWTDVRSYIHGPLGELRRNMSYLSRELLPQDQKVAIAASKDLFSRLQSIDMAAEGGNYQKAVDNYRAVVRDFNEVLKLVPKESTPSVGGF